MKYHSLKMDEVNQILEELWKRTYQGTDVDTVLIRSDHETSQGNKSYNYRVRFLGSTFFFARHPFYLQSVWRLILCRFAWSSKMSRWTCAVDAAPGRRCWPASSSDSPWPNVLGPTAVYVSSHRSPHSNHSITAQLI